jgi:hypothetical protein
MPHAYPSYLSRCCLVATPVPTFGFLTMTRLSPASLFLLALLRSLLLQSAALEGEMRQWHPLSITFEGPYACETDAYNPFANYALYVTFVHQQDTLLVPGYFAADGQAAHSSASCGNRWRVIFSPPRPGDWTWQAVLYKGEGVVVSGTYGPTAALDQSSGSFSVLPSDKSGRDFRAQGMLGYSGHRYLRFAITQEPYVMTGAGSPENFLAYQDFDGTFNQGGPNYIKSYAAHINDWNPGDPVWAGDRGKGIIGAVNYLSSVGVNAQYMLTFNSGGDGNDVWPFTAAFTYDRIDVSKVDQWDIVFRHMDEKGLVKHLFLQETENDQNINGGDLGPQRKIYYREMVARFGYLLGLIWNLGEENTNTDSQRKAHADYLRGLDPYRHLIQVHTYPWQKDQVYDPLLGYPSVDGASLQVQDPGRLRSDTEDWVGASAQSGKPWVVFMSELGPYDSGALPDAVDPHHDVMRREVLWPHFLLGGAGVEWYFGYNYPNSDLTCQDFRSRHNLFVQSNHAGELLRQLPLHNMELAHERVNGSGALCMALRDRFYLIFLPQGGSTDLELDREGRYVMGYYDPRAGGELQQVHFFTVEGPGSVALPPAPDSRDWVLCVMRFVYGEADAEALKIASWFPADAPRDTEPDGRVTPNPGQDVFQLEWTAELPAPALAGSPLAPCEVRVHDATGKLVRMERCAGSPHTLHLGGEPDGVYVFQVYRDGTLQSRGRLVKSGDR